MILVALDLGQSTAWAAGDHIDATIDHGLWRLPMTDAHDVLGARIATLENMLIPWLDERKPSAMVITAPVKARNFGEGEAMPAYRAIVRAECWRRNVKVWWDYEGTARKAMLGRGTGPTEMMKRLALAWCKSYGYDVKDHNVADCLVLWHWTRNERFRKRQVA